MKVNDDNVTFLKQYFLVNNSLKFNLFFTAMVSEDFIYNISQMDYILQFFYGVFFCLFWSLTAIGVQDSS